MICHLLCKGKICGVLGVLNNGLRVSFFYSCISPLLKSKSGQAASLRGTSCERRASCEDLQGIKKYNLSGGTECNRAFSGHLFFFFPFSTVNSQLQTALLNPESFLNFRNALILQQQTQSISPSEKKITY